jgi:hypothetical protein
VRREEREEEENMIPAPEHDNKIILNEEDKQSQGGDREFHRSISR